MNSINALELGNIATYVCATIRNIGTIDLEKYTLYNALLITPRSGKTYAPCGACGTLIWSYDNSTTVNSTSDIGIIQPYANDTKAFQIYLMSKFNKTRTAILYMYIPYLT